MSNFGGISACRVSVFSCVPMKARLSMVVTVEGSTTSVTFFIRSCEVASIWLDQALNLVSAVRL